MILPETGKPDASLRRIELSAYAYCTGNDLFYGMDVETWLKEGLLDSIIGEGSKEFIETAKASNCRFYHAGRDLEEVLNWYKNGVDGFAAWDVNLAIFGYSQELPESWAITSRMGHREDMKAFAKEPPRAKTIRLKTVAGFDVCHTTNEGVSLRRRDGKAGTGGAPEMLPIYTGG